MKKFLLLLTVLLTGLLSASAENPAFTCRFGSGYNDKGNQSYTDSWTATINNKTFNIYGANNNQNNWSFIRIGKNCTITTAFAPEEVITKVQITVASISNVSTFTLSTSKKSDFSEVIETIDITKAEGVQTVNIQKPETGLYYRITATANSTKQMDISQVDYFVASVPEVAPSTPMVTFGETTCENEGEYTVPYLTEVTVNVENAQTITVDGTEYQGSSCKFAVKESNYYSIKGKNTIGESEEVIIGFTTTPIDPALSFNPAKVELYLGDEFTAPVLNAPEGLTTFTYESSNPDVAEVDNTGKVTIKTLGENVTITVKSAAVAGKYNEGTASYTITVLDPETKPVISEFDFTSEDAYGLFTNTNSQKYESDRTDASPVTSISDGMVTLTFDGTLKYRLWKGNNGVDFRFNGNQTNVVTITPSSPDYEIESVSFVKGTGTLNINSTPALSNNNTIVFDENTWGEKVLLSSRSGTATISKITVTLRKLPEMATPEVDVQGTVLTFKCQHPAYMLQYRIYIPEWDKEQSANGPARVMAEQDWTDNEAGLGQHFTHEVNPEGKYAIEVRQSYNGNVTPVTSYYVAEDGNVSGIEDVVIDNAPAVYYNLQGVRVEGDLTPGLYIRRQGNTTTKVIVR